MITNSGDLELRKGGGEGRFCIACLAGFSSIRCDFFLFVQSKGGGPPLDPPLITGLKFFMILFSLFIPFQKKPASLPELFSRDAVLEELGVLPEDIQGEKRLLLAYTYVLFQLGTCWLINLLACYVNKTNTLLAKKLSFMTASLYFWHLTKPGQGIIVFKARTSSGFRCTLL